MTTVTYQCFYDGLKYMLREILDNKDPMIYRAIDITYDESTGQLTGNMSLEQYAITGPGRELGSVQINPDNYGHEIINGNLPYGIFGALPDETAYNRRVALLTRMMLMEENGDIPLDGLDVPEQTGEDTQSAQ